MGHQNKELPAVLWFRSLPKWEQVVIGLPILVGGASSMFRRHQPGEPTGAFVQLVLFLLIVVATELLRPKPKIENARPANLGDFQFPTATEGRVIPIVFGRVMASGPNVVWYGDLEQVAMVDRIKTGLFSSTRVTRGFKYYVGVQLAICRGPATIHKVVIGDTVVWEGNSTTTIDVDEPELFGGDKLGSGGIQMTLDVYPGTDTQDVSPYLANHQDAGAGSDRTPRYTGTCHLVARELGVDPADARGAYIGNSTSVRPWSFEVSRYPALFSGQSSGNNKINTVDANPINVLYEILTNTEWGFGFPSSDLDIGGVSSFKSAADTCITEGLGFSMIMDVAMEAVELIAEVERHIDGVLFLDHRTGKWKIKLARNDYDVDTIPEFTNDNIQSVRDFDRGTWEGTINQITVKFSHRDNNYKESHALAQDSANYLIQGGGTVATGQSVNGQVNYPGCKDPDLANLLAWRDLRARSYPLARAVFVVSREFWDLTVGSVVSWTDSKYGFIKLPMRVIKLDFGRLQANEITVSTVQDIFQYMPASFASPPESGWLPPAASLVAYPADEQVAFEAPRALVIRDPLFEGAVAGSKIMAAARRQGQEAGFQIVQRNSSGTPSGSYTSAADVVGFVRVGKLTSGLAMGVASPTTTISLEADPDTKEKLEEVFDDSVALTELGVNLTQLILVGNEFMLARTATISGANVLLGQVYRGILDSVQEAHSAGDEVFLLFSGAGLTDTTFENTYNVDVQLLARTAAGAVFSGTPTTISLTMDKRALRPYPPAAILFNGSGTPWTTPSLEGAGSGLNGFQIEVDWWRRDYRIADELAAVLADDSEVDATTEYRLSVHADPTGANTTVGSVSAWTTGAGTLTVDRTDIITAAAAGTMLRFEIEAQHDIDGLTNLASRNKLTFDVIPSSSLTGQFYLGGGVAANVATASYTALATGSYTVNIGAVQATANIQYRLNGGAWTTVVAASTTTGSFAVTSGDTIELRRTAAEAPNPQFVELKNPSSTSVAYGTFTS